MKILSWLDKYFEEVIVLTLLAVMVVIMGIQVFMRYAVNYSLSWPEELTRYMFIWFVFIGMSYSVKYDIHIRINILETFVPRIEKSLRVIQDVIFFAFCIYMLPFAFKAVKMLIRTNQHSPAMQIPMYVVYVALLIGLLLTVFRLLQKYLSVFLKTKKINDHEESKE